LRTFDQLGVGQLSGGYLTRFAAWCRSVLLSDHIESGGHEALNTTSESKWAADVGQYDLYLRAADRSRNVGVISRVLMSFREADPNLTWDVAERKLREWGSKTHLIAKPASTCPSEFEVRDPVSGEPAAFYLWVCLHGAEEALATMQQCDIDTFEANLANLKTCGVMVLPA
jgi:hypothetical protein